MIQLDLDLKSARTILLEVDWMYDKLDFEKHLDYPTGLWLILLYIGIGLINELNNQKCH